MEKRKIRRSLPPAEPPPPPLPPKDHGEVQFTDPRRFKFAIVCMSCMGKQETRAHLKNCPSGLAVDVLCGHCEFRTSSWPAMCAHLNAPGMQRKVACKPEYRLTLPVISQPFVVRHYLCSHRLYRRLRLLQASQVRGVAC